MGSVAPEQIVAELLVLFFAIGLHEYAHCKFADMAGDPTPRYYGRVTLNLFKHFEPLGTIMMVLSSISGFGLGWGRPAPMDASKMKNPRLDLFVAVAAGPISNVLQAVVYGFLFRVVVGGRMLNPVDPVSRFLLLWILFGVVINLSLALFNLIPFGPLDGHWLVGLLLPEKQRLAWFNFNQRVGMPGLFALILLVQYTHVNLLGGPISAGFQLLTGQPL